MAAPTSAAPGKILTTPFGSLIADNILPSINSGNNVTSEGFNSTVQPAANAGANFQAVVTIGKFHGTIRAQIPTGAYVFSKRMPDSLVDTSDQVACSVMRLA